MKNNLLLIFLLLIFGLSSCIRPFIGYKYNTGSLPDKPVNLHNFNTEYDDYNSTAPSLGDLIPFCFSSNRNSLGEAFDIIFMPMRVNFDKSSGDLTVTNDYEGWYSRLDDYAVLNNVMRLIKTEGNEYGPNLLPKEYHDLGTGFSFLYSSDDGGDAQIKFVSYSAESSISEPRDVAFLNSEFDDMYPSFNQGKSRIYFCSNRSGSNFDVYYVHVDPDVSLDTLLADTLPYQVILDENLSGTGDDKCPFIFGDKLVFASNREGGFGGYDLYISELYDGLWSEPRNLGPSINSEYDEYRPILIDEGVSQTQTMMVFSSNRTGGMGGFDLYFVGI